MPELVIHQGAALFTRYSEQMAEKLVGTTFDLRLPGTGPTAHELEVRKGAGRVLGARVLSDGLVLELRVQVPDDLEWLAKMLSHGAEGLSAPSIPAISAMPGGRARAARMVRDVFDPVGTNGHLRRWVEEELAAENDGG